MNVNTEKFKKLIIRIPEEQFPDLLTIVIKGNRPTENKTVDDDPRVKQLVNDVTNNPEKNIYDIKFIKQNEFTGSATINNIKYKVYNKKFPLTQILEVQGWADRDDNTDETPIDVTMTAVTESIRKSSTLKNTINMDDVWAFNFQMTRQTMTPDSILSYWFNGTESGAITTALIDMSSYLVETLAKLPAAIQATPKAIISKFLGPSSPIVQSTLADIAAKAASIQPQINQITLIATIIQELISNPDEAIPKYGLLLLSFILEKVGPDTFGSTVYDFFGGYPVSSNPLDSVSIALNALTTIDTDFSD